MSAARAMPGSPAPALPAPASPWTLGVDEALFLAGIALVPAAGAISIGLGRVTPGDLLLAASYFVLLLHRPGAILRCTRRNPLLLPVAIIVGSMIVAPAASGGDVPHAAMQALSLAFYLLIVVPLAAYHRRLAGVVWRILALWVAVDGVLLLLGAVGVPGTGYDTGNGRFRTAITPVGSLASNAAALSSFFMLRVLLRGSVASAVGGALAVVCILKDQSRTGMLVFLLSVGFVFLLSQSGSGAGSPVRRVVTRIAYVLVMVVVALGAYRALATVERFQVSQFVPQDEEGLAGVDVSRALGYQAAAQAVAQRPLLGYGFQTTRDPIWDQVVHNSYLQLGADLGVGAALALLVVVGLPLVRLTRSLRRTLAQPPAERDVDRLILESVALFAVFTLALKMCFHPLGLVAQDWIYFIAAAPAFFAGGPAAATTRRPLPRASTVASHVA